MNKHQEEIERTSSFKRNNDLESFLYELNTELQFAEKELLKNTEPEFPLIFIMGAHRSGTTLLMQWLASLGSIAYPTNLLSRFFKVPIIGSKIQLLLTDEKYNYRNEIFDFNNSYSFTSENGKTKGALSPNEYYYFWRQFLPPHKTDYIPTSKLLKTVDIDALKSELAGMVHVFEKPFAFKGMMFNYNIDFLDKIFKNAIFLYIHRDPLANITSALKARENQFGTIQEWYSFKIPEYSNLKMLSPYEQVAGQIYYINKAIKAGLKNVAEEKKIVIGYEEFCDTPQKLYEELKAKLQIQGYSLADHYTGEHSFHVSKNIEKNIEVLNAYNKFYQNKDIS